MGLSTITFVTILTTFCVATASSGDVEDKLVDVQEDVMYLKLNTLQQLSAMNTKLEWLLSEKCPRSKDKDEEATDKVTATTPTPVFKDCAEIKRSMVEGSTALEDGIYSITVGGRAKRVYCDMKTAGEGWTIIQRHIDNTLSFNKSWGEYENGFGDVSKNFWFGNHVLHDLTTSRQYSIRFEMRSWKRPNTLRYAEYETFSISDKSDGYRLNISGFRGNLYDAMSYHNGHRFITFDRDYDQKSKDNCATRYGGGWWFNSCYEGFPNGQLRSTGSKIRRGVASLWGSKLSTAEKWVHMKEVEIKVRPRGHVYPLDG